jgi:hypothetical protein
MTVANKEFKKIIEGQICLQIYASSRTHMHPTGHKRIKQILCT